MAQPFSMQAVMAGKANCPALWSFAITPNDDTDLTDYIRAITLNAGGTVAYHDWNGTARATADLPAGTHVLLARRILATGTSATGITGGV